MVNKGFIVCKQFKLDCAVTRDSNDDKMFSLVHFVKHMFSNLRNIKLHWSESGHMGGHLATQCSVFMCLCVYDVILNVIMTR